MFKLAIPPKYRLFKETTRHKKKKQNKTSRIKQ